MFGEICGTVFRFPVSVVRVTLGLNVWKQKAVIGGRRGADKVCWSAYLWKERIGRLPVG